MGRVWGAPLFAYFALFCGFSPLAQAGPGWDHVDRLRRCAFDRLIDRLPKFESVDASVKRVLAEMEESKKNPPPPPPVDPAQDPATGQNFRPTGIRGTINPDALIDSLAPADRPLVRDAWDKGEINANQLLELQLVCTLTGKPAREMLAQYAANGGHYGQSSLTVASKTLPAKIIEGEQKPDKPREVRGAHSAEILADPKRFQIVTKETNPNGTLKVKLKKWVITKEEPNGTWSKPKFSTLAPEHWTAEDIDYAGQMTLMHGKFHKAEDRPDGRVTFLRFQAYRMIHEDLDPNTPKPGSIEWEITVTDKNEITSSYPTGN